MWDPVVHDMHWLYLVSIWFSNKGYRSTDRHSAHTAAKLKRKILLIIMILPLKSLVKGKGLYIQRFQSWYRLFSISTCPALLYFIHTLSMCSDNGCQHQLCSVHFITESKGLQFQYIFLKLIAWNSMWLKN